MILRGYYRCSYTIIPFMYETFLSRSTHAPDSRDCLVWALHLCYLLQPGPLSVNLIFYLSV